MIGVADPTSNPEARVDADMDTLATALYVKTDDALKASPQFAPLRPAVGIDPELSAAELVTLAGRQALPGVTSQARWLRHDREHLPHLSPHLPRQPGYNKRLRGLAAAMSWLISMLARDTTRWTTEAWGGASPRSRAGGPGETARRSDLAGWAG